MHGFPFVWPHRPATERSQTNPRTSSTVTAFVEKCGEDALFGFWRFAGCQCVERTRGARSANRSGALETCEAAIGTLVGVDAFQHGNGLVAIKDQDSLTTADLLQVCAQAVFELRDRHFFHQAMLAMSIWPNNPLTNPMSIPVLCGSDVDQRQPRLHLLHPW